MSIIKIASILTGANSQKRNPFAVHMSGSCKPDTFKDRPYFLHGGRLCIVEKDRVFFWQGDEATQLFQVHDGIFVLSTYLRDGQRQIFRFCFTGDILGLPVDGAHICTATAVCTATVSSHPVSLLDAPEFSDDPRMRQILPAIVRELMRAREQALIVSRKSTAEKLASFFLMLVERCGREIGDGRSRMPLPMRYSDNSRLPWGHARNHLPNHQ